jgi:hypothetical protein
MPEKLAWGDPGTLSREQTLDLLFTKVEANPCRHIAWYGRLLAWSDPRVKKWLWTLENEGDLAYAYLRGVPRSPQVWYVADLPSPVLAETLAAAREWYTVQAGENWRNQYTDAETKRREEEERNQHGRALADVLALSPDRCGQWIANPSNVKSLRRRCRVKKPCRFHPTAEERIVALEQYREYLNRQANVEW